ncbi:hypothetical protein ACM64Y_05960 [Novispirillum sp. DQ9]|uniref:hypothetical protein n=1 Tax=Novispirillum sp. DQ9 TaxID=3398612 RepID=UPI003C7C46F8
MMSWNALRAFAVAGVMMSGAAGAASAADGCIENQSSRQADVALTAPGSASARIDFIGPGQRSCYGDTTGLTVRVVVPGGTDRMDERTWDDGLAFDLITIKKTGVILTHAGVLESLSFCRDGACFGRLMP